MTLLDFVDNVVKARWGEIIHPHHYMSRIRDRSGKKWKYRYASHPSYYDAFDGATSLDTPWFALGPNFRLKASANNKEAVVVIRDARKHMKTYTFSTELTDDLVAISNVLANKAIVDVPEFSSYQSNARDAILASLQHVIQGVRPYTGDVTTSYGPSPLYGPATDEAMLKTKYKLKSVELGTPLNNEQSTQVSKDIDDLFDSLNRVLPVNGKDTLRIIVDGVLPIGHHALYRPSEFAMLLGDNPNSLFHEYAHFLDHAWNGLQPKSNAPFITGHPTKQPAVLRHLLEALESAPSQQPETIQSSYASVFKTAKKLTPEQITAIRTKPEMFARAFAAYVYNTLGDSVPAIAGPPPHQQGERSVAQFTPNEVDQYRKLMQNVLSHPTLNKSLKDAVETLLKARVQAGQGAPKPGHKYKKRDWSHEKKKWQYDKKLEEEKDAPEEKHVRISLPDHPLFGRSVKLQRHSDGKRWKIAGVEEENDRKNASKQKEESHDKKSSSDLQDPDDLTDPDLEQKENSPVIGPIAFEEMFQSRWKFARVEMAVEMSEKQQRHAAMQLRKAFDGLEEIVPVDGQGILDVVLTASLTEYTLAAYDPNHVRLLIGPDQTSSIPHEFAHYLDNVAAYQALGKRLGNSQDMIKRHSHYLSYIVTNRVPKAENKQMKQLLDILKKLPSQEAMAYKKPKEYYYTSDPAELFARAFDAYVQDKLGKERCVELFGEPKNILGDFKPEEVKDFAPQLEKFLKESNLLRKAFAFITTNATRHALQTSGPDMVARIVDEQYIAKPQITRTFRTGLDSEQNKKLLFDMEAAKRAVATAQRRLDILDGDLWQPLQGIDDSGAFRTISGKNERVPKSDVLATDVERYRSAEAAYFAAKQNLLSAERAYASWQQKNKKVSLPIFSPKVQYT